MKKVNETEIDNDLTIEQFEFEFTEEEKEKILKGFKNCPEIRQDALDCFMMDLERHVDFFVRWIKNAPKMLEHVKEVKDIKKNLTLTKRNLKLLYAGKIVIPRLATVRYIFDEGRDDYFTATLDAEKIIELAKEAEKPIALLYKILDYNLKCLEKIPIKTGKPSADLNSGLVDKIGELLLTMGITPTGYTTTDRAPRGGGLFFRLVKTVFEILEIEIEDPSRLIKSAVKKLS